MKVKWPTRFVVSTARSPENCPRCWSERTALLKGGYLLVGEVFVGNTKSVCSACGTYYRWKGGAGR